MGRITKGIFGGVVDEMAQRVRNSEAGVVVYEVTDGRICVLLEEDYDRIVALARKAIDAGLGD